MPWMNGVENRSESVSSRLSRSRRRQAGAVVLVALVTASSLALGAMDRAHTAPPSPASAPASLASASPSRYAIGTMVPALKLSRLQMLSTRVGVGVAPIVTFSGRLRRGYLVRTNDGGASWRVTGVFPLGVYPWTTAFISPRVGYAIDSTGALYTADAGRTWAVVTTTGAPLSISVRGRVAWLFAEHCHHDAMNGPCATQLDVYDVGAVTPTSVAKVPGDQPFASQVGPTSGYVLGSGSSDGVFATIDDGRTWRLVDNPCRTGVSGGAAVSPTHLLLYCGVASTILYVSSDGGSTWQRRSSPSGGGFDVASGSSGAYIWQFDTALWESHDGGGTWQSVTNVRFGPSGAITTYGVHDAWHAVPGHGIYRTTNGITWTLLR